MGHMWGRLWMGVPSASVLNFASLFPPKGILVPHLKKEWSIHILVIVLEFHVFCASRVIQAFGLIATYQWVHTMCIFLWLGYLTQDDIFQFQPFVYEFHKVIVHRFPIDWVVFRISSQNFSLPLCRWKFLTNSCASSTLKRMFLPFFIKADWWGLTKTCTASSKRKIFYIIFSIKISHYIMQ